MPVAMAATANPRENASCSMTRNVSVAMLTLIGSHGAESARPSSRSGSINETFRAFSSPTSSILLPMRRWCSMARLVPA